LLFTLMVPDKLGMCIWLAFNVFYLNAFELSNKWESLTHIYETYNEGPGFDHYYNYGLAYDENIHQLREVAVRKRKKVKMVEIGIQSGGSTRVWKRYFRGTLEYVGIDIDPRCKQFEILKEGIRIEIGSQLNTTFLESICSTYGPFDLVVDDGGHTNRMMWTSLNSLWSCLNDNAVYVIEDLHTMNMGPKYLEEGKETVFKKLGDWMKVRSPPTHLEGSVSPKLKEITHHPGWHLRKLSFYDSMLFLVYGKRVPLMKRFRKGLHWIPNWTEEELEELQKLMERREPRVKPNLNGHCKGCCVGCYDD
jgi:hypothetical protein